VRFFTTGKDLAALPRQADVNMSTPAGWRLLGLPSSVTLTLEEAHMRTVEASDGRRLEFPETLTGKAKLIGPQGGEYEFDAELLRAFLHEWVTRSVIPSSAKDG
jgi:hypothetical protein